MGHRLKLQSIFEIGGIDAIVFDGVGGAHELHLLQPGDGTVKGGLHLLREGAGQAGEVHLPGVLPHRLQEKLVAGLFGKAHDLILDAGTVAGADALDGAAIQGTAADILPDDLVGLLIGVADVAGQLILQGGGIGGEGGRDRRFIAVLLLQPGEIDTIAVDACGGAGFEPAEGDAQSPQAIAEAGGGVHAVGAGFFGILSDKNFAL